MVRSSRPGGGQAKRLLKRRPQKRETRCGSAGLETDDIERKSFDARQVYKKDPLTTERTLVYAVDSAIIEAVQTEGVEAL